MPKLATLILVLLAPTAALALGLGPPLPVPAAPAAPPELPPTGTPPVLELDLPMAPPEFPFQALGTEDRVMPELPMGPPEQEPGGGIPDLSDSVSLPEGASRVPELAPPFGALLPAAIQPAAVPEPSAVLLLAPCAVLVSMRRRRAGGTSRR